MGLINCWGMPIFSVTSASNNRPLTTIVYTILTVYIWLTYLTIKDLSSLEFGSTGWWGHTAGYLLVIYDKLEMWANAQRDGHPAEYRWRPLFNAAVCWRPLLECRAVTLPRRETRWNYPGCPKLTRRSQPLLGQSSPYCGHMWGRYCCLTNFFSDCRYMP